MTRSAFAVVMKPGSSLQEISGVLGTAEALGFRPQLSRNGEEAIVGLVGPGKADPARFHPLPGVDRIVPIDTPFKLASRELRPQASSIRVGDAVIGGGTLTVIAGPCAVESLDQVLETADRVRRAGATILRGGAFKPRTSPYSFRGLGRQGLEILAEARRRTGLAVATEVMTPEEVPVVAEHADILQVGARNMQNFNLLDACGRQPRPVLLKRGLMSTVEELLLSAEYVLAQGNPNVILCERGIRTFETSTRNTLDLSLVPVAKRLSHLPVIVDPSHASGAREYVEPLSLAAVAVGADGLLIEVHPDPERALCDGRQSLGLDAFDRLMNRVNAVATALRGGVAP